jgi:hypothetical protein
MGTGFNLGSIELDSTWDIRSSQHKGNLGLEPASAGSCLDRIITESTVSAPATPLFVSAEARFREPEPEPEPEPWPAA